MSDQARQLIEQRMEEAGVSNMNAFIRKMCLNGLIIRLDIPQIPDSGKYLKSASNNLNQIARRLNSGGSTRAAAFLEVNDGNSVLKPLHAGKGRSIAQVLERSTD